MKSILLVKKFLGLVNASASCKIDCPLHPGSGIPDSGIPIMIGLF